MNIQYRILEAPKAGGAFCYTGVELRTHWNLEQTGVYGSLITAFVGGCDVPTAHLVDWEDRLQNDRIYAKKMLHFIGEFFGMGIESAVLHQRLFMVWAERLLREEGFEIVRSGDDLFVNNDLKLSVSIATVSPVSALIHWGINIDSTGAPSHVKTAGLNLLGWDESRALSFAKKLLTHYIGEIEEIRLAQCKVRPV